MITFPDGCRHFANAHFPGLYSVVIGKRGDLLTRLYIAKPGELSYDLQDEERAFLWHAHGYSFKETTVIGTVENICVRLAEDGREFNSYHIRAGIDTGRNPELNFTGKEFFEEFSRSVAPAGGSFSMSADVVHRVVFRPDRQTNWFCCLVEETAKATAPDIVYSPWRLYGVPFAELLYKPIGDDEARALIWDMATRNGLAALGDVLANRINAI